MTTVSKMISEQLKCLRMTPALDLKDIRKQQVVRAPRVKVDGTLDIIEINIAEDGLPDVHGATAGECSEFWSLCNWAIKDTEGRDLHITMGMWCTDGFGVLTPNRFVASVSEAIFQAQVTAQAGDYVLLPIIKVRQGCELVADFSTVIMEDVKKVCALCTAFMISSGMMGNLETRMQYGQIDSMPRPAEDIVSYMKTIMQLD